MARLWSTREARELFRRGREGDSFRAFCAQQARVCPGFSRFPVDERTLSGTKESHLSLAARSAFLRLGRLVLRSAHEEDDGSDEQEDEDGY